ncbi:MAG: hypothetical protein ACK4GR_03010, partial [bacterium]
MHYKLNKETIYLILQDIQLLIEKLKNEGENLNSKTQKYVEETQKIIREINEILETNNEKEIYKKILELKTIEFKLVFQEAKNSTFYKFWENLIQNIKKDLVTPQELNDFYTNEMNKLLMNAEIVVSILTMEDEDILFKTFLDIMFGEAFKIYYEILQKLKNFINTGKYSLLDEIIENLPSVVFYFSQIQKLIPKEYAENV